MIVYLHVWIISPHQDLGYKGTFGTLVTTEFITAIELWMLDLKLKNSIDAIGKLKPQVASKDTKKVNNAIP